ncbi:hypothetical protein Ancab_039043, partial [Ancistrocladus abbreviatus]
MAATPRYSPSSTFSHIDKVAILTHTSHNISKVVTSYLVSFGAKLIVNYVFSATTVEEVVHAINSSWFATSSFPRAMVIQADVSDPAQVKAFFDTVEK